MYRVVKIEETHAYLDEDLVRRSGGKIYSVYVYNDAEITHLCEITPSYWLEEVDVVPETYPDNDEDRDELLEDLSSTKNDEYGIYVHCHQVDSMASIPLVDGEDISDWDIDTARQFYQSNQLY